MEKLNEYIQKCADEIKSRGLCEKGDEARPAFLMVAVTKSSATNNANISAAVGGDGRTLVAAIAAVLDDNLVMASIFKAAVKAHLTKMMRTEVKCNAEC